MRTFPIDKRFKFFWAIGFIILAFLQAAYIAAYLLGELDTDNIVIKILFYVFIPFFFVTIYFAVIYIISLFSEFSATIIDDKELHFYTTMGKKYCVDIHHITGIYLNGCTEFPIPEDRKEAPLVRPPENLMGTAEIYLDTSIYGKHGHGKTLPRTTIILLALELLKIRPDIPTGLEFEVGTRGNENSSTIKSSFNLLHMLDPSAPMIKETTWKEELDKIIDKW